MRKIISFSLKVLQNSEKWPHLVGNLAFLVIHRRHGDVWVDTEGARLKEVPIIIKQEVGWPVFIL